MIQRPLPALPARQGSQSVCPVCIVCLRDVCEKQGGWMSCISERGPKLQGGRVRCGFELAAPWAP